MKIWFPYNNLDGAGHIKPYDGPFPPYYNLKGKQWYDKLTNELPVIKEKVFELYRQKDLLKGASVINNSLLEAGGWASKTFIIWKHADKKMIKRGYEVFSFFKDIPGFISLSISVLQPGSKIKAHNGDTNAIYRMHVPISIPGQLPECGLEVAGEKRSWPEEEITVFCDAHLHTAWNYTKNIRIILIVDVIKEEFSAKENVVCASVAGWLFAQTIFMKNKLLQKTPVSLKWLTLYTVRAVMYVWYSLNGKASKY